MLLSFVFDRFVDSGNPQYENRNTMLRVQGVTASNKYIKVHVFEILSFSYDRSEKRRIAETPSSDHCVDTNKNRFLPFLSTFGNW